MNTNKYLILNNENVVVNISVGPTDTENERSTTHDIHVGWKLNDTLDIFLPPDMTTEDFNEMKTQLITKCEELKLYYDALVVHAAFDTLATELKVEVNTWLSNLNKMYTDISSSDELVLAYHRNQTPGLQNDSSNEPLQVRPNLENEV